MFNNVGKQIQILGKVVFYIGFFGGLLLFLLVFASSIVTENYVMIAAAIIFGISVPITSWISSIMLCGFGKIVENTSAMRESLAENNKILLQNQSLLKSAKPALTEAESQIYS